MTRIGVLGAGQLGRMLALAGLPLDLQCRFFDPAPNSPASHLAEQIVGDYADADALRRFTDGLDLVTYEFENVPVACARALTDSVPVYPPPAALDVAQERLAEKRFLQAQGVPTPPFAAISNREELDAALARIGLPAVLKTCRGGYDGKGQLVLTPGADGGLSAESEAALAPFLRPPCALILEGFVAFRRELSLLAVRGQGGECRFYPLVENQHREGILRLSLAPAPEVAPGLQALAEGHARRLMDSLGYVGVLAIELFEVESAEERLVANEIAPRVHNSGHWTIEGAETSQFENHLRAVAGLPLGDTAPRGLSAMVNLIGELPDPAAVLAVPGAHLHLYGKAPRPGRKLGHITLRADDPDTLQERLQRLLSVTLEPGADNEPS